MMEDFGQATNITERFDSLSDDELHSLIKRAGGILQTRQNDRCKVAVEQIRRLAKENGLNVSVRKPARKRGRPPKNGIGKESA